MAIKNRQGKSQDFVPTKLLGGEFAVVQEGDESSADGSALYLATKAGSVKRIPFAGEVDDLKTKMDDVVEDAREAIESAIDPTLTQSGKAADAKKTGDEIADLKSGLKRIKPLSEEAKQALLACFEHVAWIDEHGQTYYDALYDALYPESDLVRIEAVFNQGTNLIYEDTPLNDLKAYLTVTGYYNDSSSMVVTDYALSGTLEAGTSIITVAVEGKTATFNVVVTAYPILRVYVGKGISYDTTQVVDNPKRCISEKVPFVNQNPITVQWVENDFKYRWALKNELPSGAMDDSLASWFLDYLDYPSHGGWVVSGNENTKGFLGQGNSWKQAAWSESSGYGRILFAPYSGTQDDLPSELPSGYMTITGTKYKIVAVTE